MLLILLANMLILAHAVVPHHHHDKVAVAVVNVLGNDHHHDGPSHHHDSDDEDCLMTEAEAAAALKIQTDDGGNWSVEPLLNTVDGGQFLLAAIGLYELSFIPDHREDTVRRRPYVASGHADFVARSKGLRAPPTC